MDLNPHRDVRSDALDDLSGDQAHERPVPGEGARQAQRAADIERQEFEGMAPRTNLWRRITRWVGSVFGRR
jgi:hypothetical protein